MRINLSKSETNTVFPLRVNVVLVAVVVVLDRCEELVTLGLRVRLDQVLLDEP